MIRRRPFRVPVAAAALFSVVSCGGKQVDSRSDSCTAPDYSTSEEAFAAVKCRFDVPRSAALVDVRSSPGGDMREDGRSRYWIIQFADEEADSTLQFDITGGIPTETTKNGAEWCFSQPFWLLPSSIVVPDAAARVRQRTSYDHANYFILQKDDSCLTQAFSTPNDVLILTTRYNGGPDEKNYWFSFYDEPSTFQRLCGPCDSDAVSECDCAR